MSSPTEIPVFDVCGPLPEGTCVLEASAGTGKTWTIAALAARFVAEGVDLASLMMVTFSRAASQELRMRIRQRLESTRSVLADAVAGRPVGSEDAVDVLLTTGSPAELRERFDRVAAALSDFDSATIATTHEFCQRMLDSLGVLADTDPDATLVENLDQLTREVVADHYLQHFARPATDGEPAPRPWLSFDEALVLARSVVDAQGLELVPSDDPDPRVRARVDFALGVRAEVARRKRWLRLSTFDDMLSGLQDTLDHREHGEAARTRLRERYPVVLIDEFQDTDPVQWHIVREAFHGHSTLILIGDPKQAVYGFRGADVHSYLQAVAEAEATHTLGRNWRSDPAVVAAVLALFEGAALGDDRIMVRAVEAALPGPRMRSHSGRYPTTPLRIRAAEGRAGRVGEVRRQLQEDLVRELGTLVSGDAELCLDGEWRPVRASDVAVLVRANARAEEIRTALAAAGIPAVVNGTRSVHASESALAWATLLEALLEPHQRSVRAAALTPLVGWSLNQLAAADDQELGELRRTLKTWSRVLERQGVAALMEAVSTGTGLAARLLRRPGGERELTDLRHVAEGLHQERTSAGLGTAALLAWLRERISQARADSDQRSRRLETDADAVQILTYHHSKGLQFPIVYLPSGWDRYLDEDGGGVLRLHDDAGQRVIDVGGREGQGRAQRFARARAEDSGDDLRLLYVALTRAQCQVVAWWGAASRNTPASALHRLLQRDRQQAHPEPEYPAERSPLALDGLPRRLVAVEAIGPRQLPVSSPPEDPPEALRVRLFQRELDLSWRRTSYSSLTAAAHGAAPASPGVGSEPLRAREDDEPVTDEVTTTPAADGGEGLSRVSPLQDFPGGTAFGSLVHSLLEYADPTAEDVTAELTGLAARELARLPAAGFSARELAEALTPAVRTPLGPLAGDRSLADVAPTDRLPELDFELPLAGGTTPGRSATLADVADCLERHLPADDPLVSYPERLRDPALGQETLRGFLTGSVDAVLRVGEEPTRHLVVDYKTNWLGPRDDSPLTLGRYGRTAMAEAMMASHYPLQAVLYCVALHRYLRWRLPGYRPGDHLGGVLYLFVRGMAGPDTPLSDGVPCGVFSWHPPAAMVEDLSALLAHGPGAPRRAVTRTPGGRP
ncbi:UvrD-helicase domain-containing protein [Auraticoccus monumenti]|uniref:RecBCD enzyme subunit RecB n=1 Tax=Auraticoccus monumenti TaxID=675864 RepID=A0A1G7AN40_9ACTN|nr:UvrD-helicase domain-containing protein [Auraticoccus monumenti]SDE15296.1 exodeoxyribonuclease V beta subunit [Auraticoccus monumenti]